ncbi:UNVERIFIED_CONTAM: hypothetical protein GTU68_032756 [Idotea baltica]|nr:hypothetical protein [Idotea baltica]
MEEAVLGSMMMDKEAVSEIIDILEPNSFYVDAHQIIYKAMKDLFADSQPIDLLTVSEKLRKMGKMEQIGGAFYLSKLTNTVASTANIEAHARVIAEKFIKRELIKSSNEIIKDAFEEGNDALDLLDKAQRDLFGIAQGNIRRNYDSMGNLLTKALAQIEEVSKNGEGVTGVPSGFVQLDAVTAGWQKSDLIVMAARPGMGKTSFVLALARNAAVEFKKPIAIFSLEMSSVQLVQRLISSEAEIPSEKLRRGDLADHEWAQLTSNINNLGDAPIFIDDTPGINIFELRAKCRRLKMNHDIQMIVIDYLQLMTGTADGKGGGNREQEISSISRALKGIAKELEIPVIALSQLSRAVEQRGGLKKPQLSDLRESGAIEQDADMVIFLYRPEYYGFDQDEDGNPTQGLAEIIIAKHRNGSLETVKTRFIGKYTKFVDLDGYNNNSNMGFDTYPSAANSNFQPPQLNDSGNGGVITLGSKMNTPPPPRPPHDDDDIPF